MKVVFVYEDLRPVAARGYGGVQLGIRNYRRVLESLGHEVAVVKAADGASIVRRLKIIREVNSSRADVVHIKASKYFNLSRWLRCDGIFLSDHAPGTSQRDYPYHRRALQKNAHILCLSPRIREHYLATGASPNQVHLIPNGLVTEKFRFTPTPKHQDRSIYLAIVNRRKRQHLFCDIPGLDFVGPVEEAVAFDKNHLGEWSRKQVEENLTDYANLVLLSASEGHANVCLEAMAGGLGLVVSEAGAANLDTALPFIDVVPENKITDREFVTRTITKNRAAALAMRAQIREYAKNNFDVAEIVEKKYLPLARAITAA